MRKWQGTLYKLSVIHQSPVSYHLPVGEQRIHLNTFFKKKMSFHFTGQIHCIQCGRLTKKSFQQGFCFPCLRRINECGNCMLFPERCQVETGHCPQDDWAHERCYAQQIVYLANASGLKVGVTCASQVPTRWIDQGAIQAIPIFQGANRYRAGLMEVALKRWVSDRTQWRAMLTEKTEKLDMLAERDRLLQTAQPAIDQLLEEANGAIAPLHAALPVDIDYPILEPPPQKIVNLSLDKQPDIAGKLMGIKGQYLILDTGVLNIRKYSGYEVECVVE